MPTITQLIKKNRKKKYRSNPVAALEGNPQKKGIVLRIVIRTPKKPNSALRKVAYVRLSNKRKIYSYIIGDNHNLKEHSVVLVRGGRVKDLPGIRYKMIRGVYDFSYLKTRKNARSKYGTPRNI